MCSTPGMTGPGTGKVARRVQQSQREGHLSWAPRGLGIGLGPLGALGPLNSRGNLPLLPPPTPSLCIRLQVGTCLQERGLQYSGQAWPALTPWPLQTISHSKGETNLATSWWEEWSYRPKSHSPEKRMVKTIRVKEHHGAVRWPVQGGSREDGTRPSTPAPLPELTSETETRCQESSLKWENLRGVPPARGRGLGPFLPSLRMGEVSPQV